MSCEALGRVAANPFRELSKAIGEGRNFGKILRTVLIARRESPLLLFGQEPRKHTADSHLSKTFGEESISRAFRAAS